MKTYWHAFLNKYPWMVETEVVWALEAFWYFCNGYSSEQVDELCNKRNPDVKQKPQDDDD